MGLLSGLVPSSEVYLSDRLSRARRVVVGLVSEQAVSIDRLPA